MLHHNQQKIAKTKARFKVLVCGRRFGKTTYSSEEMGAYAVYQPYPVRYFATTVDQARDIIWKDLVNKLQDTHNFVKKDESRLEIHLKSHLGFTNLIKLGGWENIETARGKNAGLLVLDEVDSMRNFDSAWNEILRPMLSDTKGAGIFMGTPKGKRTLYRLSKRALDDEDYKYLHFTSYDNPYLDPAEIDKAKRELSDAQFRQEYLAEFTTLEGLVYSEFSRDRHVKALPFVPERWGLCIDFGFNHPLAAYILAISADDRIHVARELYQRGLDDNARTAALRELIGETPLDVAVGDSEDPIAIIQVGRELGINLDGAVKGKDSVISGINKTKALFSNDELTVDPSCLGLIDELEAYVWKPDTNGQATDQPVKESDDAVDSLRYGVMKIRHDVDTPSLRFL